MFKTITMVALALLASGCAELEVAPGKRSNLRNAPINEATRAGIVSYSKEAMDEEDERQRAYNTMAKSCNGKYKILKEELRRGSSDYFSDGGKFVMGMDEDRVYIHFTCVD